MKDQRLKPSQLYKKCHFHYNTPILLEFFFMMNIIKSRHSLLVFTFDKLKQRFASCSVSDMCDGVTYYLVEPSRNRISAGIYKKMGKEEYNNAFPMIPVRGNFSLFLFITRYVYPSITNPHQSWLESQELTSLSNNIDDSGVCLFEHKKLNGSEFSSLYGDRDTNVVSNDCLPIFFADIHRHLEDREIRALLNRLYSGARTETGLAQWKEYKASHETYVRTQDRKLRNQLIDRVAINQGNEPSSVFIERLTIYKTDRAANTDEYYTPWARFFGGSSRSRLAKLNAVDSMIASIRDGRFSIATLPAAAKNGELNEIVQFFSAFPIRVPTTESLTPQYAP